MPLSSETSPLQASRTWVSLGLTFLLLGIGFATPIPLTRSFPPGIWEGEISREALNLYALTAFLGWGHFAYAWQGQLRATRRLRPRAAWVYWLLVLAWLGGFFAVRQVLGVGIFSLLIWVYNIGHLIKAETFFAGTSRKGGYRTPAVAFAWFTLVLFRVGPLRWEALVFAITLILAMAALWFGDWRLLTRGASRLPVLTLFLLGETLVWSAYQPYMTAGFRVGIYVFHIAAASFFHYTSSYIYAQRNSPPMLLRLGGILGVNAFVVLLGYAADRLPALRPLRFVLDPEWFTLWVALHLAASDLLPWWRKKSSRSTPALAAAAKPFLSAEPPQRPDRAPG